MSVKFNVNILSISYMVFLSLVIDCIALIILYRQVKKIRCPFQWSN